MHAAPPGSRAALPSASRSNSAVAARACRSSDSSTSGQTTNAWRPARSSSRTRSYARARSASVGAHERLDRLAAAGELAQHGVVEVAVAGQRERPRDRRGGHVQHVGALAVGALGVERGPLAHAEAVLLVDHRHAQAGERHRVLDQRVGAHDQRQLAARELAQQVRPPAARRRAGQQPGRHGLARHQRLDRGEVLVGERLGRRHQRALVAVLDRAQQRVQRHHGLARADLAHQQPLHRPRLRPGRGRSPPAPRADRRSAGTGSSSESQRAVSSRSPSSTGAALASRRVARRRSSASWAEQQLVEGEPALRRRRSRRSPRGKWQAASAPARSGSRSTARSRGRQRLDDLAQRAGVLADQGQDLGRGETLGGGVVRHRTAPPATRLRRCARATGRRTGCGPGTCRAAPAACPAGSARPATAG